MRRALAALALSACVEQGAAPRDDPDAAVTTWAVHVAPIVGARCAACHRADAIGGIALDTYASAAGFAPDIATEVRARRMPPALLHPGTACRPLRDDAQALTDAELATILRWINAGWPEGRAGVLAPAPPRPPPLSAADLVARMPRAYTPDASRAEDFRCFVVDPGNAAERYLTAYEVVPGFAPAVHHVTLFALPAREAERAVEVLDARDEAPGYPCFGGAGVDGAAPLAVWKPGDPPMHFPAGSGLLLRAGGRLVLQVRYTLANGAAPDVTAVRLQTAAAVAAPAVMIPVTDTALRLPPRVLGASAGWEGPLGARYVHGVAPQMLALGQSLRLDASDGAARACLVDLPRWDHHWQGMYFFREPLALSAAARVRLGCRYDTRSRSAETAWGEGLGEERCAVFLYATERPLPP